MTRFPRLFSLLVAFSSATLTVVSLPATPALAQVTETVLHSFCTAPNCTDGNSPYAGLTFDPQGNLYGTTTAGGTNSLGTVFELSPPTSGSSWTETALYSFCSNAGSSCTDGSTPFAGLILDSAGNVYGTTLAGGTTNLGTVFELSPPASGIGAWTEKVLYSFCSAAECFDGESPYAGLIFDSKGNLYGTTFGGGTNGAGVVFELSPPVAGTGPWTEAVLYSFGGNPDGSYPYAGLIFDSKGNLYGTTHGGGQFSDGTVFLLTPSGTGPWAESVLYSFCSVGASNCTDGSGPRADLIADSVGNFYGTTESGGAGAGVAFELSPPSSGSGPWTEQVLYNFCSAADCIDGSEPFAGLAFDSNGNLYGTTVAGGVKSAGIVFELIPPGSSDPWTETVLYNFCSTGGSNCTDGAAPQSAIIFDSAGNLYGTTVNGGGNGKGTAFELPPRTASAVMLTTSSNPSVQAQPVTFTATVSPAGAVDPTGAVTFTANGLSITGCSGVLLSFSLTAQCITSSLPVGVAAIVASYSGDSNYTGSTVTLAQVVIGASLTPSTTSVTSSLNPSHSGAAVTFTAAVNPAGPPGPTGTVTFLANGQVVAGCSSVSLSSGSASCSTTTLPVGNDPVEAAYSGDNTYQGSVGTILQLVNPIPMAMQFVPVTPCRVVDTRNPDGPFGGPALAASETRNFDIPSGPCAGIPTTATAYSLNVTVVPPAPLGYLTIWPAGEGQPVVSTLNSLDGRIKANAAIVPAGASGEVSVFVNNPTHVVLDINGYFESGGSSALEFYPLTPCRVADTRNATGPLGGPSLAAATERDFPILASSCGIPGGALAYSLNFTAIPPSGENLGYVTVWPQGESRPVVSTLNDVTGTIVANAAIVPAGTSGGVAVYPSGATNLVIDVNGYFALPGSGGLSLYALTPCRALDTRKTTGAFSGELVVNVAGSTCTPSSTAQAYVFNATVVPSGELGYLTLWADGETHPVVSTLNAVDGAITSNMAIVQNVDGQTDAFASGTTQLVLDISAYFAP